MRAGPIVAGSILLIVALAAVVGGAMMRDVGDWCVSVRCDEDEPLFVGMIGSGVFMGGMLAGLAGIGLIIAGVVAEAPRASDQAREVQVGAAPTRACPSCSAAMAHEARYCSACGAAVAPAQPA